MCSLAWGAGWALLSWARSCRRHRTGAEPRTSRAEALQGRHPWPWRQGSEGHCSGHPHPWPASFIYCRLRSFTGFSGELGGLFDDSGPICSQSAQRPQDSNKKPPAGLDVRDLPLTPVWGGRGGAGWWPACHQQPGQASSTGVDKSGRHSGL